MNTPMWLPLVVAAVGIVGTLSGVWLTSHLAHKREAISWTRQQEQEKTRWAREDAARTFEFRRSAYVAFYEAAFDALLLIAVYMGKVARLEVDADADAEVTGRDADLQKALDAIRIYGTPRVLALAEEVQQGLASSRVVVSQMHVTQIDDHLKKESETGGRAFAELHFAIREELGVPNTDSPDAEAWRSRWAQLLQR